MDSETEGVEEQDNLLTTITIFATTSNDGSMNSTVELLDPDVANTKGRPRMMSIKEAIKVNKFYKCGHSGSTKHTKKNCPNLHLVYNLPKSKKPRKNNKTSEGKESSSGAPDVAKNKKPGRQKKTTAKDFETASREEIIADATVSDASNDQTNGGQQSSSGASLLPKEKPPVRRKKKPSGTSQESVELGQETINKSTQHTG